mmetsp:Transcript_37642/g.118897  ORF Transcript_37642/g.118897 Transcript_37642/m.118897 type:complete len:81 (-) Transcript_37642:8-250(-)
MLESLQHARQSPKRMKQLGEEAERFGRECLRMADVMEYMRAMLAAYSSAMTFPVRVREGAYKVSTHEDVDKLMINLHASQ